MIKIVKKSIISIHAPRVGSDVFPKNHPNYMDYFNPRSPCGERQGVFQKNHPNCTFQSTLPVWGATTAKTGNSTYKKFQSTLPVWGATLGVGEKTITRYEFQSTLPVWGATAMENGLSAAIMKFQSTLPVWGATCSVSGVYDVVGFQSTLPVWGATGIKKSGVDNIFISIHAPRVGSDSSDSGEVESNDDFNPRSPCGERHLI